MSPPPPGIKYATAPSAEMLFQIAIHISGPVRAVVQDYPGRAPPHGRRSSPARPAHAIRRREAQNTDARVHGMRGHTIGIAPEHRRRAVLIRPCGDCARCRWIPSMTESCAGCSGTAPASSPPSTLSSMPRYHGSSSHAFGVLAEPDRNACGWRSAAACESRAFARLARPPAAMRSPPGHMSRCRSAGRRT